MMSQDYINYWCVKRESCKFLHSDPASPKLLVFGNPLLDITVQINDDELLNKYNLERNGQMEVPFEKLAKLIGDAKTRYETLFAQFSCHLSIKQWCC